MTFFDSRSTIRGILLLSFAVFLACAAFAFDKGNNRSSLSQKADTESARAQQIFASNCAGCHGLDGKGGERAPDIVTRPNVRQLSDSQLLEILQKGIPEKSMPSFNYLDGAVLRSLVAHLRTLQGNPATAKLPGDARRGWGLFFGKAGCSRCHMVRGEGGFFGSDLTAFSRGRSPEVIHDAIVFPNRDIDPRNRTVVAVLPSGKTLEGIARNEDNFSIQLLTQDGALYSLTKSKLKNLSYRKESPMPADYETRLSASEIDDLVNYLASLSSRESRKDEKGEDEGDED
jgi:cytochrome c oxidase cbb3-type subunit III